MTERRRWQLALISITGVAALIRVSNLGTFSAWLDEILTLRLLDLAPGEVVHRLAEDAENSPLCVAVLWIFRQLGLGETSLRLIPIAAGLASIVLLAIWIRSRVGREVALIAAAVCALSAFHLRYSQELRPYPFLLLAVTASLVASEHLRRTPRPGAAVGLGLILAAGLWTHLSFALTVPILAAVVLGDEGWRAATRARALAGALILGFAGFLPWLLVIGSRIGDRAARGGGDEWTVGEVLRRLQFLSGTALEGDPFGLSGAVVSALAVVGVVTLARRHGLGLVLGVAALSVLFWEAALVAAGHWSNGRYDTFAWPFLPLAAAAGLHAFGVAGWRRAVATAVSGLLVVTLGVETVRYLRHGRPDWRSVARVVAEATRTDEPVVAENPWSQISLRHYLADANRRPVALYAGAGRLILDRRGAVVVLGGYPNDPDLRRALQGRPRLLRDPDTAVVVDARRDHADGALLAP